MCHLTCCRPRCRGPRVMDPARATCPCRPDDAGGNPVGPCAGCWRGSLCHRHAAAGAAGSCPWPCLARQSVFAVAPLRVLWFGFGMSSEVVMAVLVIFFPVTSALGDGLRQTEPGGMGLARTLGRTPWGHALAGAGAYPPACRPLHRACGWSPGIAPQAWWWGSVSAYPPGWLFVMQTASIRFQADMMFAALPVLAALPVALWWAVDRVMAHALSCQPVHADVD